jgi:hypothetical protein
MCLGSLQFPRCCARENLRTDNVTRLMPSSDADLVAQRAVGQAGAPLVRLETYPPGDAIKSGRQISEADLSPERSVGFGDRATIAAYR